MSRFSLSLGLLALMALMVPAFAQTAPSVTMKIATVAPDGTPWSEGLKTFKKNVEDAKKGVTVKVFTSGTLGDENETVQATQRGQIQGVGASTGAIASLVPELNVLEMPYLFKSEKQADCILDKVILSTVEKALRAKGLVLGFWSENGYRSFGTSFGFIKSPADLKGKKMRSQENGVHLGMYREFGASPTPIPVTEVLTSLQTGVVDGYDNTMLFAQAAQWTSATKYYTMTNHIYQPAAIIYNAAFYDGLSKEAQALLMAPRSGLAQQMRDEIRLLKPMLEQNMKAMKIQVYKPTTAELATFEPAAKKARDTYIAKAGAGEKALYQQIVKGLPGCPAQ
jgi:tripartite ATP-independent transporter DctP family solute receptor